MAGKPAVNAPKEGGKRLRVRYALGLGTDAPSKQGRKRV